MDSEILIACHCEKHPQMYYVIGGVLHTPVSPEAQYVDPYECPEKTWDKIAENSKTYIWGVNCPVAMQINNVNITATGNLIGILDECWRVLKRGGQVIFPGRYEIGLVERVQALIDSNDAFRNKWRFSIIKAEDFTFSLGHINIYSGLPVIHPILAVFTKPASGGRSKCKTLKKRKRRSVSRKS